jgi:hypothetical protein
MLSANDVAYCVRGAVAGPLTTRPLVSNCELWHRHTNVDPLYPVTLQDWCVHTDDRAVKLFVATCATRKAAFGPCANASAPTLASGDAASTVML